jgi:hypothetical protein
LLTFVARAVPGIRAFGIRGFSRNDDGSAVDLPVAPDILQSSTISQSGWPGEKSMRAAVTAASDFVHTIEEKSSIANEEDQLARMRLGISLTLRCRQIEIVSWGR